MSVEPGSGFAGEPDPFDRLWTPHRMAYVEGADKPKDSSQEECPFCRVPGLPDAEGLVVRRGRTAYVVMNLYPYSPGHMLVCPYRHLSDYTELADAERDEVAVLTQQAMRVVRAVSGPHGINLGMNQGEVAGAGIKAHLHQHVVPRWRGDANFMPIVARTKPVPELLGQARDRLADQWRVAFGRADDKDV